MSNTAVSVAGVTKAYGNFVAVSDLSFEVPAGTIYGVLGPNGAGKTTTLRMITNITIPDRGTIKLLGNLPPGGEAARRIGYLPEERGLYPKMRVLEVMRFFGELRGIPGREATRRGQRWLERLEIASWAKNRVQDLSKGMQQKVQFCTALISDPEVLILDEPWAGLDPINAEVLREIVLEQRSAGKTILFSTHLMEQAEKICDHVCIIARGERALEGALADIKREAASDRVIALAFSSTADRERATDTVLADGELVAHAHHHEGGHTEIELAPSATARSLLEAAVAAGIGLRRFEIVEPDLHQIFVDKVGERASRDQTTEATHG
ncbi:MAG TPA: ATP-binding cassette domain-containing protein [Kofleriaceae bacterium]|nr:ATP-binding cassette domain-containing protein [Kofleriaceae bacterium]